MASMNFVERKHEFEVIPMENGQVQHKCIGYHDVNWQISIYNGNPNLLSITKDGETRTYDVKVDEKREFTIQVRKTFVRGIDGAEGIFNFLTEQDANSTWNSTWANLVWNNVKRYHSA
jgi:hypothetical protein